jgi:hypothetical protein
MRKLYNVKVSNGIKWSYNGAIDREFGVLAEDSVSALMLAEAACSQLKETLHSQDSEIPVNELRVTNLHEVYEVISDDGVCENGAKGQTTQQNWDEWATGIAKRIKLDK